MPEPIPMERPALAKHVDTAPEIREASVALSVKASRIAGILRANAALPEMRQRAKDDLITLARDALALHGLL